MDRMIRELQEKTGDVVVVVTVPTVEPYADAREYAVKLFENQGRGVGQKGKDNGLLILLALKERRVQIEVGYGLEGFITDGFSGETSREVMAPEFRNGRYGPGLLAGTERLIGRIAQGRNVTLDGVRAPRPLRREPQGTPIPLWAIVVVVHPRPHCQPHRRRTRRRPPLLGRRTVERLVERRRTVRRRMGWRWFRRRVRWWRRRRVRRLRWWTQRRWRWRRGLVEEPRNHESTKKNSLGFVFSCFRGRSIRGA
jgi:uncharacterized membrane protein YgcG